jgi:hypothetical protein
MTDSAALAVVNIPEERVQGQSTVQYHIPARNHI